MVSDNAPIVLMVKHRTCNAAFSVRIWVGALIQMLMIMENKVIVQGPGVSTLLLVAFIVMKLCGVIT